MDAPVDRLRVIAFSRPAAFVVAEGEGFFADESLAVEHTQARGSAPQLDALVRGDFDPAHTAADNIVMRVDRDGADLAVVCVAELGVAQRLVVRPEIATIGELRGKDLGVDAIESGYATLLYNILDRRGVARRASRPAAVRRTAPPLAQAHAAMARVVELRHPGRPPEVERYFDPSFTASADPALA